MKIILIPLLVIFSFCKAQELKIYKATKQTINAGAFPRSITNYSVILKKRKSSIWQIDSIINLSTLKAIEFNIVKVDNVDAVSPNYTQIKRDTKLSKGIYQLTFYSSKSGSVRNSNIESTFEEIPDFVSGIIYCRIGDNQKKLKIESFIKLETINAP